MKIIKIFDYVDKAFPKQNNQRVVDLQTVFSDRVTCEYCQDVIRRVRKGELISSNQYKANNRSDAIDANFNLFSVDGKPLYGGEQIGETKYKEIIRILGTLP